MNIRQLPEYLPADWPAHATIPSLQEWEEALRQDQILRKFLVREPSPISTPESILEGDRIMAEARKRSKTLMLTLIENKTLLTAAETKKALSLTQAELKDAIALNQIFSMATVDGQEYYPSFFCEKHPGWQVLKAITQELKGLPGPSQFYFFTSPWHTLGGSTPISALRNGKIAEVRQAAICFLIL